MNSDSVFVCVWLLISSCVWSLIGTGLDLLNLCMKARWWLTAGWVSVSYVILISFMQLDVMEQIPIFIFMII